MVVMKRMTVSCWKNWLQMGLRCGMVKKLKQLKKGSAKN